MNLVDQIFEQAKAGSAQGQGFGQFFAEGVSAGQRQQQINQQQQQLAMEIAQAPLKQTLLQQDSDIKALSIEQLLKKRNDDIQNTKAFMGLQDVVNSRLEEGDLPEAINAFTQINTETPDLWVDPRSQALGKQLDAMQKEADRVKSWSDMNAARMKAAEGASFRGMPPDAKYQRLLENAQSDLNAEISSDNPDPETVTKLQDQIGFYTGRIQMAKDKLINEQNKVVNEQERIKAQRERTAAINARTLELGNRLNKGDLALMNQKIKVIQDLPNSKMDFQAKMKAIEDVHSEFERKTKGYSQPTTQSPATTPQGSIPPKPPASNGEDRVYVKKDGKTYWVPRTELPQALREGYTQDTTYAE